MSSWKIVYSKEAKIHIEEAVEYYNFKSNRLGNRFYEKVKLADSKLKINPYFQVRYNTMRCLPLEIFPYTIHFEIDEKLKLVKIYAIISTLVNPDKKWLYSL